MSLDGSCSGTMTGDDMVPSAKIMRSWFVPNIVLGRVRADPRRQDQLVPMGCANTKIVKPWFEPNILFFHDL